MSLTSKAKAANDTGQVPGVDLTPANEDEHQADDGLDGAGESPAEHPTKEHVLGELLIDVLMNRNASVGRMHVAPRRDPEPREYEAELIRGHNRMLSRTPDSLWFRKGERVPITAKEHDYLRDSHARQKFEDRHAGELVVRRVPVFRFYKNGEALPDREWPEERLQMCSPDTW